MNVSDSLKGFVPKMLYPKYEGMTPVSHEVHIEQMFDISNLIADMVVHDADHSELIRAVRHSMVVIDAGKHHLDYKQSAVDNGIAQLKTKYQGGRFE